MILEHVYKNSKYHLYADDTVIYCSADSSMTCTVRLNVDLTSLSTWCNMNKVTINTTKTKAMNFGTRQKLKANKCQTKLMLNNDQVKLVPTFRYLGVLLDNCLTFSKHISKIIKSVSHKLYLLNKIRPHLTESASINLYKAMILPYFDYADVIYDGASNTHLKQLQNIQNRALRLCLKERQALSISDLHNKCKLGTLQNRRQAHLLNLIFYRTKLQDYIDTREIRTRAHDDILLKVERPLCTKFTSSVLYKGALAWNALGPLTRSIVTYEKFKKVTRKLNKAK